MAKARTVYLCRECGAEHSQWFGKCPSCGLFGSLDEQVQAAKSGANPGRAAGRSRSTKSRPTPRSAKKFSEISDEATLRLTSGYREFDRVLGGGIVPGSLVLIGGDPGIGKSTLLLQTANQVAQGDRVLYVSAEESGRQIKLRAMRLQVDDPAVATVIDEHLYILPETDLDDILREIETLQPQIAIIDSIQTVYFPALTSAPGSVSQVRECTSALMQVAKRSNIAMLLVGHVTKEGAIAGPRVLEHLVDTVLYFEGDRYASHRILRSVKNRFGATHEIGIFDMVEQGLREVPNPSELFLGNREAPTPGTATIVACEGTRPIVVELQALVSPTSYASPRRSTTGVDYSRLQQILAVLEKRVGVPLSKLDAYVSSAGGLVVAEPAADLGIAIAVVASFRDRLVDTHTILIGEVGLGGQIRPVTQLELRLREAQKLGFKRAIIPENQAYSEDLGLEIITVGKVIDAIVAALPTHARYDASPAREEAAARARPS
ncbi:DNA repair protein RadA [Spirulina major]|uniref:DNA repair protein RadA n=1 Tax=Spirulina major TaxID=270636 RepID=UPI000932F9EB|nr:DNA repair protein RadA [Spirulina major]